jgi:hypothetical protein
MKNIIIATVVSLLFAAGCSKKAADEIEYGTVENHVYKNAFFSMTMKLPEEWSVHDQESRQHTQDLGNKMLVGDDKNLKAVVKASELSSVYMFAASKHPIGSPVESNPTIQCIAERVRYTPGIKSGEDYLFHAKKFLEQGQIEISFPYEISTESIGGVSFDILHTEIPMISTTVRQKIYATIIKGYALLVTESYTTDDELLELDSILHTLSFE